MPPIFTGRDYFKLIINPLSIGLVLVAFLIYLGMQDRSFRERLGQEHFRAALEAESAEAIEQELSAYLAALVKEAAELSAQERRSIEERLSIARLGKNDPGNVESLSIKVQQLPDLAKAVTDRRLWPFYLLSGLGCLWLGLSIWVSYRRHEELYKQRVREQYKLY